MHLPRLLERREISDFVNAAVSGPDIVKCDLDEAGTCLVVHFESVGYDSARDEPYDCEDIIDLVPYEIRKAHESPDAQAADFIMKVEAAWAEMERRLRLAIAYSLCRVMARCGSMHAAHFTAIRPTEFALYNILDWRNGVAESETGEKIYSIHVAQEFSPNEAKLYQEMRSLPWASRAARYFLAHPPVGFPHATITTPLVREVGEYCGRPTISFKTLKKDQALAADLVNASPLLLNILGIH